MSDSDKLRKELIKSQEVQEETTEKLLTAYGESSDNIIAVLDSSANEINENFSNSIDDLNSTFEWSFTEIIWSLEQQQKTIKKILDKLDRPLEAQAIELKKRGFLKYKNQWYDEAQADLEQAAKYNDIDFTIHQTIGNIFLFHKYNPKKAIESYEKSIKYSKPYSKKYASFAFLHLGLVYYSLHDYQSAYNSSLAAIQLSPKSSLCYYEHARYCAKLGKKEEAIKNLREIVFLEPHYCAKIYSASDFLKMRNQIQVLFDEVFLKFRKIAVSRIQYANKLLDKAKSLGVQLEQLGSYSKSIKNAEQRFSNQRILDFYYSITVSENTINDLLGFIQKYLEGQKKSTMENLNNLPQTIQNASEIKMNKILFSVGGVIVVGTGILFVIAYISRGLAWMILALFGGLFLGLIVALIICGILFGILFIYYWIKDKFTVKNKKNLTNKTLEKIELEPELRMI